MAQQSDRERWWTVKVSVRLLQTPEGRSLRYRSGGGEKLAERHSSFRSMARNTSSRPKCPFPAPVPQFGWSWIGIGSSDCEPAGGCRLAQSESRIHGAQQRQSVSQPVEVWAALGSCALLHSLSRRQRRGGRREVGGERTDPLPGAGATNGRRAARTERTSYLSTRPTSVRAGEFPPLICYRSARVNKGLQPLNRAFLTLFSNTARKQFLSASNSTEETLGVWEPYNMRASGCVCVCG